MLKTQHKKLSVCKLLIVAVVGMLAVIFFVTANAQTIPLSACSLSANNCTYPLQHILQPGQTLSSGCTGGGGMCTTVTLPTYAPPPCTASLPNLRISGLSIGEQRLSSWSRAANVTQLDPRERYSLVASVQNASCRAVSSGAVRTEERCSTRTYGNTRYRSLGGSEYWVDRYRSNPDVTVATTATSTLVTTCRDVRVGFTEPPYSETRGNFPATLEIDLNSDGTIDETRQRNNESIGSVPFGDYQFPAGTHELIFRADIPGTEEPGRGCNEPRGCIQELNEDDNELRQTLTVTPPSVSLGSYLRYAETTPYAWVTRTTYTTGDLSMAPSRTLPTDGEPALMWEVDKIKLESTGGSRRGGWGGGRTRYGIPACTGESFDSAGNPVGDFAAEAENFDDRQRYSSFWSSYGGRSDTQTSSNVPIPIVNGYALTDTSITRPPENDYHLYTITCETIHGDFVSDTHIIGTIPDNLLPEDDATSSEPILVRADLDDAARGLEVGESLTSESFDLINENPNREATDVSYTLTIDDTTYGSGSGRTIPAGGTLPQTESFSWTPATQGTYDLEVCAEHPDDPRNADARCDTRAIIVTEPGVRPQCGDGIDNDGDGFIDYDDDGGTPDPGCNNAFDDDETDPVPDDTTPDTTPTPGPTPDATPTPTGPTGGPTIEADPTVVRQGDDFTLTWNTNGNSGCALSPNTGITGEQTNTTDLSQTFTAERTTTYTIDCDGDVGDTVTVRVIPILFET